MARTLIVFETKYGSTEEAVKKMALVLGPGRYCRTADFKPEYRDNYDLYVLGGPIRLGKMDARVMDFASANKEWLSKKKVAIFATCLVPGAAGMHYLEPLAAILGECVACSSTIAGRLKVSALDPGDLDLQTRYYEKRGKPLVDLDPSDPATLMSFALRLKSITEGICKAAPAADVMKAVDEFLKSYNTCVVCTGSGKDVRGTPVTYKYRDGHIYVLTEGGRKFANLLVNNRVGVVVHDPSPSGKNRRAGLQLDGEVTILSAGGTGYREAMETMGLKYDRMTSLPWAEHVLDIKVSRGVFRWREF